MGFLAKKVKNSENFLLHEAAIKFWTATVEPVDLKQNIFASTRETISEAQEPNINISYQENRT